MAEPIVRPRSLKGPKAELAARLWIEEARSLEDELRATSFGPLELAGRCGMILALLGLGAVLSGAAGLEQAGAVVVAVGILLHSAVQLFNRRRDLRRAFSRELLERRLEAIEQLGTFADRPAGRARKGRVGG